MGGVPSKAGDPSTTEFQVIGAGYCRTGTVSMQLALETLLDGPVMHGGTHVQSREDSFPKKFLDAFEARRAGDKERTLKLLKDVTAGFVGCTDMPCIDFVPELVELYPEAKVVLVQREPAKWWNSVKPLMVNATAWYLPVLTLPMPTTRWFPGIVREWKTHSDALLGGKPPGPGTLPRLVTVRSGAARNETTSLRVPAELIGAYNEWVIRSVPKDRLLVMGLEEGWAPLCKFLDKPVPSTPFPRANEAEAIEAYTNALLRKLASIWLGLGVATGGSMYLLWRLCSHP